MYHPDKSLNESQNLEKFKKIQQAKMVLLNSEMRKKYDQWLNSSLSIPFEQWLNLSKNVHTSMHWVNKKKQEPMLPFYDEKSNQFEWTHDMDSKGLLENFRSYEI